MAHLRCCFGSESDSLVIEMARGKVFWSPPPFLFFLFFSFSSRTGRGFCGQGAVGVKSSLFQHRGQAQVRMSLCYKSLGKRCRPAHVDARNCAAPFSCISNLTAVQVNLTAVQAKHAAVQAEMQLYKQSVTAAKSNVTAVPAKKSPQQKPPFKPYRYSYMHLYQHHINCG